MKIILSEDEKQALEVQHKSTADRKVADRIKSVLLRSEGWSLGKISQALRIHNDTISGYLREYKAGSSFSFNYQGSSERLTKEQSDKLISHLETNLYSKVVEIVAYVESEFGVSYTVSGLTDWLRKHDFSYKKPKGYPAKVDIAKQHDFIEIYEQLKAQSSQKDEPILFIDGA